ncbi:MULTISPECIES: curli assembly protein CsgF [Halanaerobium]|jgi:curli production assembly/transport component CsgF|uniref:Curli production assembly/transport component CsgF n=1 Tax=Halanaerobium kushneri TaxID=56779 RepID=A0A1N6WVR4_9FIRM|nr:MULTISPECIES: curli assembly protein CsgF [Halanaerobium]RCW62453.1 type VIII secretion system (T8SS) CsgF protein [Halanaerobium sp. ST460_2HS_T2]SIQ94189.1 Type VIII secretion system (T8SS), CsgF protein [Halanaerobium kushneri]
MKKTILYILLGSFLITFLFSNFISADSTTSWSFQTFNDPDARQVAQNIASTQHEMSLSEDPIAQFISGLNGRIMSLIQQDIVNKMVEDGLAEGNYDVGNLEVTVNEDEITGVVTIILTNKTTGEVTEIEYSTDDWPSAEDLQ